MNAAPANSIPPGVTVFCDPTLGPAMRSLDRISQAQAGAPVSVLSAPAMSMLEQIKRHTRNDVLFTLCTAMDVAEQLQFIRPDTRLNGFFNPLVLAGLKHRNMAPAGKAALAGMAAGMRLAVTDDTVASGLDGRAILAANGLAPAASRVAGAANTADVAYLIISGAADIGLVYATDVSADPRLGIIAILNAAPALTNYAAAVNAKAVSPNAQALLNVMRSADGNAALRRAGLEMAI